MGEESVALAKQAPGEVSTLDKINLLLVEDSSTARLYIRLLLEFESTFEIIGEASRLSEALEALRVQTPDVILLDFNLPDAEGIESIPQLLQKLPTAWLIVISVDDLCREKALAAGAKAFLTKPFNVKSLVQALSLMSQPSQLVQV